VVAVVLFGVFRLDLMGIAGAILSTSSYVSAADVDDRIESSAKASYNFKTYLKNDNIHIESKNGAVALTGTVSEESHKSLAQETVASLPKVQSVDNRLEVNGERPDEHTDGYLTTKVKTNLMFHRHVSAGNTEVVTNNGIVTLKGEADNQAQKDLTTEYAKDVEGVKEVRNEMTVAKNKSLKPTHETMSERMDDASITGQVKMTLLSHRSTSAINTRVETSKGVVTLRGVTKNSAEKALVAKLADDVYGVKNVNNQMTIRK
jgi:osmotically-inducible protein OsmY